MQYSLLPPRRLSLVLVRMHLNRNFALASSSLLDSGLGNTGPSSGSRTLGSLHSRAHRSEGSSMRRSDVFSMLSDDNMEEELEKTKVVKAFWDLRQEV